MEQSESVESLATLGLCLAMIAHEVNNLLTPVRSAAELAMRHPTDQDLSRKALTRAAAGATKSAEIMQSLLALSKGGATQAAVPTDVRTSVELVLHAIGRDPKKDGVDLQLLVPRGTHALVHPVMFQQAMMNLILNAWTAVKQRPAGQRKIVVNAEKASDGCIPICVTDTGPGLPASVADDPFRPFGGAEQSGSGAGLGLSIAQHLLKASGGSLALASSGERGTAWRLSVPVAVKAAAAA